MGPHWKKCSQVELPVARASVETSWCEAFWDLAGNASVSALNFAHLSWLRVYGRVDGFRMIFGNGIATATNIRI